MKQVFRRVLDGKGVIKVEDLPVPNCGSNQVLVATKYTAISAGTEGATLSKTFPELVKQTLQDPWMRNAVKGLIFGSSPAVVKNIVWDETTLMRAIGYSGAGVVVSVGDNASEVKPGDRVAFAAEGHAEFVAPTKNYVVPIPESVDFQEAAFVTLGGIAMQGVRRAEIDLGDKVAVIGLGLVGLIVSQLVSAAGGQVIGIDINDQRLELLGKLVRDAESVNSKNIDPVEAVTGLTGGYGADKVIICAASKDPIIANQAMKMARKQGVVVFVGIVKMDLERMPFFRNELDIRFSRAYGPGVMDPEYEKGSVDYPRHYIRWTQQRNLAEFLRLIAIGKVTVEPLIGGVFNVEDAQTAYDKLYGGSLGGIAALLEYDGVDQLQSAHVNPESVVYHAPVKNDNIHIGVIGCGNFTRSTHIPNLDENKNFEIAAIASSTGVNAVAINKRFSIPYSTTDYHEILSDENIDAVLIATRHNLHSEIACKAIEAGKHVFVEKPAALNWDQHNNIKRLLGTTGAVYMVGYNRRYAPLALELKSLLQPDLQFIVHYQVCVPEIPADHWTLNPEEGGGRLVGEAEHFFDFINYLVDARHTSVTARCLQREIESKDTQFNFSVEIEYANRAFGTVTYTSFAAPGSARETITVYQAGRTFVLEDFKSLRVFGAKTKKIRNVFGDMGHKAELEAFVSRLKSEAADAALDPLAASAISLTAMDCLKG